MGRLPTGGAISAVVVDPENPPRVYASNNSGVFRSDDAGETWVSANQGLGDRESVSLALDPSVPRRLFALTAKGALYVTQDGASTWQALAGVPRPGT